MTEQRANLADESPAEWAAQMSDAELCERVVGYCDAKLPRAVAEEMVRRLRGGRMHNPRWLEIHEIRKRIDKLVPTTMPPATKETREQTMAREIQNRWLSEWNRDRKDLHQALDEIEMLRKFDGDSAVLVLLHRWSAAREATAKAHAAEAALDGELEKIIAFVRV